MTTTAMMMMPHATGMRLATLYRFQRLHQGARLVNTISAALALTCLRNSGRASRRQLITTSNVAVSSWRDDMVTNSVHRRICLLTSSMVRR